MRSTSARLSHVLVSLRCVLKESKGSLLLIHLQDTATIAAALNSEHFGSVGRLGR